MTTRLSCHSCSTPARFVDANHDCPTCAQSNPHERGAIALFDDFKVGIGWPSKQWDDPALDDTYVRETFRHRANRVLKAAIDPVELARTLHENMLGFTIRDMERIAKAVTTHYLGSEAIS